MNGKQIIGCKEFGERSRGNNADNELFVPLLLQGISNQSY